MRILSALVLLLLVCLTGCSSSAQDRLSYHPIPRYPHAENRQQVNGVFSGDSVTFITHDTIEEITQWYSNTLTTQGWMYKQFSVYDGDPDYQFHQAFRIEQTPGNGVYFETLLQMEQEDSAIHVLITQNKYLESDSH